MPCQSDTRGSRQEVLSRASETIPALPGKPGHGVLLNIMNVMTHEDCEAFLQFVRQSFDEPGRSKEPAPQQYEPMV